jgi:cold shock protein
MCPKETHWATIGASILTFKTTGREQGGSKDVFVHISAVERAGLSSLTEGQVVEYEEVSNRGKTSAENLRVQRTVASMRLLVLVFAFSHKPSRHRHGNGIT